MLMLLAAVLLGWRSSLQRGAQQLKRQEIRLQYAEEELRRARDLLRDRNRPNRVVSRVLDETVLDGANLRGVTIASSENAFQRASLRNCNLTTAVLEGGDSAFQLAHFDGARLVHARLKGGFASFQEATFNNANLTDAVLLGRGSSFQRASFENATLVRARLAGSFQAVNLTGAHLEGADLSAIAAEDLASCYFKQPPTYDDQTRFPAAFDPAAQQWARVSR
jgi:uncharacterized protein YjbI with pentapeptide repeats